MHGEWCVCFVLVPQASAIDSLQYLAVCTVCTVCNIVDIFISVVHYHPSAPSVCMPVHERTRFTKPHCKSAAVVTGA